MNSFNVHYNLGPGKIPAYYKARGFTAVVVFMKDEPRKVTVYQTLCSRKDEYNKKKGVEYALAGKPTVIYKRDLPAYLAQLQTQVAPGDGYENTFMYVLKRMV